MRNKHDSAGVVVDTILEPFDRGDVQVVGRLIQQQQVGFLHECPGQRNPPPPAAREFVHLLVGREAQFGNGGLNPLFKVPPVVRIDLGVQRLEFPQPVLIQFELRAACVFLEQCFDLRQSGANDVRDGHIHGFRQRLVELADDQVLFRNDLAPVWFERAHDQLQCRRLAGAISADQADALAGIDRKLSLAQDELIAKFEADVVESQQ